MTASHNAHGGLVKVHPILTKRPGERFETRVLRSRLLTPTTHRIELEKPAHFTFQPTQFTFLQLETPTGLEVPPMSLATSATRPHLEDRRPPVGLGLQARLRGVAAWRRRRRAGTGGSLPPLHLSSRCARRRWYRDHTVERHGRIRRGPQAADSRPSGLQQSHRGGDRGREELEALERSNPNFQALYTLTRAGSDSWKARTGRIGDQVGPDLLADAAEALDRPVYYLCGAPGFVKRPFGVW